MQHFLDMRTLFMVVGIIGLILFLCMLYVLRTRKTYPGFSYWTAASLLYFIGNLLLGFRNILPDMISIVIANTIAVLAVASILYGLILFTNNKTSIWPLVICILIVFLLLVYFTYYSPNTNNRIIVVSTAFLLFCLYALIIIYRYLPPLLKSSNLLTEVSIIIGGTWASIRLFYTIFYETNAMAFMQSSSVQSLSILIFCGLFVSLFFGLSVLNFQRVENDLFNSKKEIRELEGIVPMCASCKKIRDDSGFWNQVESYIQSHSDAKLSHAICPECMGKLYPDYADDE